jgi:uncharacterized lipoprotein YajG
MKNTKLTVRFLEISSMLLAVALMTGCANPKSAMRRIYLHEYSPTVTKADTTKKSPLQGATISIKGFADAFDCNAPLPDKNVSEPQGYLFSNIATNAAEKKLWDHDAGVRIRSTKINDWNQIGYVRNIFGSRIGGAYAVVPPGEWLSDTLKMDLANQGARIVESEDATVTVQGTISYLTVDMCFKYWADLIVDVEITVKGKRPVKRTIHTIPSEHTGAGSGSAFEFFKSLRQCQQKFSGAMIDELENALLQSDGSGK